MRLPSGTITFLFTDIEGSTKRWDAHPVAMQKALLLHDRLLREAIEAHNGHVFKTVGDAFCAAFASPYDAILASIAIHFALKQQDWGDVDGLRVRIGVHTGVAEERDNDYFGPTLNRVARLQSLAYGAQTLLSQATLNLCLPAPPEPLSLEDLGQHWLKDLQQPEHVWQLNHPDLPSTFPPLRSLHALPNNLPQQLTSLIGREEVVNSVRRLLVGDRSQKHSANRMVTLTGAGGIGKTRLALQVAAEAMDEFPDGVWLIELASYTEEARMVEAIASVLKVQEEHGKSLLDAVIEHCRTRKLLLILDNCEQIVQPVATIADRILRFCPTVWLLATSREALAIVGEHRYRVPSLDLPNPARSLLPDRLMEYGAVRLFVERAIAVKPEFALTAVNASTVNQICHRLDGIPLATELAAARIRSMPISVLASRLEANFQLLTGGSRAVLPRHQTLRALIDWSYDLLTLKERLLFNRLSVFSGGLTLEMAEAVCTGCCPESQPQNQSEEETIEDWEVLDLLSGLVDKSLVLYEEMEMSGRYRLLEPLRQYGWELLKSGGELSFWRVRHRDYFQKVVVDANSKLLGVEQSHWLNYLSMEGNNVRAALNCYADAEARSILKDNEATSWMQMVSVLMRYWYIRGPVSEGREWIDRVLALHSTADVSLLVRVYNDAGILANLMGDRTIARTHYQKALDLASSHANAYDRARTLNNLALVEEAEGNYECMAEILHEVLAVFRELDLKRLVAITLINLGLATKSLARLEEASACCLESLSILNAIGDTASIASVTEHLAELAVLRDDLQSARRYLRESIDIRIEQKNLSGLAFCLEWGGSIAVREGQFELALSWLATADQHRNSTGRKRSTSQDQIFRQDRARAWEHLEANQAQAAWLAGEQRSVEEAIEEVRSQFLIQCDELNTHFVRHLTAK